MANTKPARSRRALTIFPITKINLGFWYLIKRKWTVSSHIYGDSGYWDKNIQVVFNEEVYNEITADKAKLIRDCIDQDKAFNDKRLQQDKDDFIYFLNQAVVEKWRLFLIDKN